MLDPFSQLIAYVTPRTYPVRQDGVSKTDAMRSYLQQHRRATAAELAKVAGLGNTGLVYALLKQDILKNKIARDGNEYVSNQQFDAERQKLIYSAIKFLNAEGYQVIKKENFACQ
jgi:hypothetical protein